MTPINFVYDILLKLELPDADLHRGPLLSLPTPGPK